MIRADQLQIGDFVLVDGNPRRVESITKKKIGYHLHPQNDKRLYYARLHDVEPILITRELLKDLDFVECKGIPYDVFIHMDETARLFLRYDNTFATANAVAKAIDKEISYLHQYQQICRIDGVEIDWEV